MFGAYLRFAARRPSGFAVASLVRAPDAGEDAEEWAARVRQLVPHGPLGQHTHFGGATQARPREGDPAGRVRADAEAFRRAGLEPRWFCGGGWYVDREVAAAAAELGYRDCTATSFRPAYLEAGAPRLHAEEPVWLDLGGARLFELPTTHPIGPAVRAAAGRLPPGPVHVYFHDYDLRNATRTTALAAALALLARRRGPSDLDAVAAEAASRAPTVPFATAAA